MQRLHGWVGRNDRFPVEIDAVVLHSDGNKVPVKLTNLTDQGCRIDADHAFQIGERLVIALPRMGQIKAQVRWALPGSAGTRFLAESDF